MFELYLDYPHSMIPLKDLWLLPEDREEKTLEAATRSWGWKPVSGQKHIETEEELEKHIFPESTLWQKIPGPILKDYSSFLWYSWSHEEMVEGGASVHLFESCNPKGRGGQSKTRWRYFENESAMTPEIRAKTVERKAKP